MPGGRLQGLIVKGKRVATKSERRFQGGELRKMIPNTANQTKYILTNKLGGNSLTTVYFLE